MTAAKEVLQDYEAIQLEFFSEYAQNGGNATAAAIALGIPERTGRRWIEKQNGPKVSKPGVYQSKHFSGKAKILVIPDTQVKPGVETAYMRRIGQYIMSLDDKPTHIVHIGDHWDMPSLSSYDKGKKSFEGRRYKKDILSGNVAMDQFFEPIDVWNRINGDIYKPEFHFHFGNHEHRVNRAIELQPEFEDVIGLQDMSLSRWTTHKFQAVNIINGVAFSHFFTTGVMGRPASSAKALINQKHMSCVMGHVQKVDIAYGDRPDGKKMTAIFAGTCYEHDEDYLGPQGNNCFRGIWILNEVEDGDFQVMQVSLDFLKRRFP